MAQASPSCLIALYLKKRGSCFDRRERVLALKEEREQLPKNPSLISRYPTTLEVRAVVRPYSPTYWARQKIGSAPYENVTNTINQ
ncbi:hypothetical protein NC652_001252 [Populus alba x Populus x berolinensis]|nr:hypothetical protein NC652_001252 [Populus alba x Populus x berolinensis]